MNRGKEIVELLKLTPEELGKKAKGHLLILESLVKLHEHFARSISEEIKSNNKKNLPTVLILPYGPIGQYPILVDYINNERISLKKCTFFFMDEYADINGVELPETHFMSFKGGISRIFSKIDSELRIRKNNLIFPTSKNIHNLSRMINNIGGVQTCYGGIGIHGHIAFNEPEKDIKDTNPRLVYLNDFTVTINCIREGVGGDLVNFPRKALTLGMKQILSSRRIRLYCRNDVPGLDWANTVLRLIVAGQPGDDYPATHVRSHNDWRVITDRNTATKPKHILEI
jgi:glucosamine-6-phosphate deaminase